MFDNLQYKLLRRIAPSEPSHMDGRVYNGHSKLAMLLGGEIFGLIRDKLVVDFGCGTGQETVELARNGVRHVIGLDIQESLLRTAQAKAAKAGVANKCSFVSSISNARADVVICLDSFEHFSDPAAMLDQMYKLLQPGGCVVASFGPTWYHPLGGHLFSIFPWAHLLFSEKALIRWRSDFRTDGATCFAECAGGLNKMTIRRFTKIAQESPFVIDYIRCVPIRLLSWLHCRWTREFTSAILQCKLSRGGSAGA